MYWWGEKRRRRRRIHANISLAALGCLAVSGQAYAAQPPAQTASVEDLRSLSIEDLSDIEIISVSRRAQPLSKAPAAVYVITNEDIRRSGATSLPEALRLAPNLEVVRQTTGNYAISARGLNDFSTVQRTGNKLLVLIDGRTVYTPLHSGVFWDQKQVMLDDIERIEVISGSGGTLWGANAVNGVINVISRNSRQTQGGLISTQIGNVDRHGAARYGGSFDDDVTYRVYGMGYDYGNTVTRSGDSNNDDYHGAQGGFRTDASFANGAITVQGDRYQSPVRTAGQLRGENILGRMAHTLENNSNLEVQAYYDKAEINNVNTYNIVETYDISAQHAFAYTDRQDIVWGGGYRLIQDAFRTSATAFPVFVLEQPASTSSLINIFGQDTIALLDNLKLTLGTKFEHNHYTGLEVMPNARLAWEVSDSTMLWTAISRAVRTPSRVEREFTEPTLLRPSPDYTSEKLISYELGYRGNPIERTSASVTLFYNQYDDLRTVDRTTSAATPFVQANRAEGDTYGIEAWGEYQLLDWWRLGPGFNVLKKNLTLQADSTDTNRQSFGNDPEYQYSLRSRMDLPHDVDLDASLRAVDGLSNPAVRGYLSFDARLGWHVTPDLELSVAGFNLFDDQHQESGTTGTPAEIRRSIYAGARWKF